MIEHNYYQLMEIDAFADVSVVRKRYRELAMLYHPDKNPNNAVAEEFFKILTHGYNILSEPDKKLEYDILLRNYYFGKVNPVNEARSKHQERQDRIKKHKERKRQEIIEEYVRSESVLSHKMRLVAAILIFSTGVLMAYNNWFINLLNFNIFYIVGGSFLFGLGSYMIANIVYRRRVFKRAMSIREIGKQQWPVRLFVILFLITPVFFLILMQVTKSIHLTYFYDITIVERVVEFNDQVTYNYFVNGNEISRQTESRPECNYMNRMSLRVKFSKINPNISELITVEEASRAPR